MKKFSELSKKPELNHKPDTIKQKTDANGFVILKPEFLDKEKTFTNKLNSEGWKILQKDKRQLSLDVAKELYVMHKDKDFYNDLCNYMSSGECLCCSCYKDTKDPIKEMNKLKDEIRDLWGKSEMKNAMHSSDSLKNVKREAEIIFKKNNRDNK